MRNWLTTPIYDASTSTFYPCGGQAVLTIFAAPLVWAMLASSLALGGE